MAIEAPAGLLWMRVGWGFDREAKFSSDRNLPQSLQKQECMWGRRS